MKPQEFALIAGVVAIGAIISGGWQALGGYALGVSGSLLNLVAWWMLLGTVGRAVAEARNPRGATFVVVLSFLLKAPLLFALAFGANRIGGAAVPWCMGGVVLVYFGLVGWALGRS